MEPAQRPEEDLLDEEELAAELGLSEDGEEVTELEGFGPSFAEELEELAQEIETSDGADRGRVQRALRDVRGLLAERRRRRGAASLLGLSRARALLDPLLVLSVGSRTSRRSAWAPRQAAAGRGQAG